MDPVLQHVTIEGCRFLALLLLLALCLSIRPAINSLDKLVEALDDELLVNLQPHQVIDFIHNNLPRKDSASDSMTIFFFDEVSNSCLATI